MAFKICRRTGKIGYRSIGEAKAQVRIFQSERLSMARRYERLQREIAVYKCQRCPRWHLTSQWQDETMNGFNL